MFGGSDGYFPEKKYDFLEEKVEEDIALPSSLSNPNKENHYPVIDLELLDEQLEIPKPRQIFASSGNSSVQLRRLGELMWIYIETLPSTSWPISKNYWDTSIYEVISADPNLGEIQIDFDTNSVLKMKVEHGIKEASTEIFLYQVSKTDDLIQSNPEFNQTELEKIVEYFASSISNFSGTSLAAQNLNEMKKANIFTQDGRTVIALDLNFDRAWSAVSRALEAGNITSNDIDRDNGIFLVSYSVESDSRSWFSFLNFNDEEINDSLLLGESAEFRILLESKNDKTNIIVESLEGIKEEADALLSKINELLS